MHTNLYSFYLPQSSDFNGLNMLTVFKKKKHDKTCSDSAHLNISMHNFKF